MGSLVKMKNITKKFPGVTALDNISFDIEPGEVHVLLGENGAGKSTLMKILSGVYRPTSGKITVNEKEYDYLTPKDSYENGISIIYQELSVINELSIMENIFVGKIPVKTIMGIRVIDYPTMRQKASEALLKVGLIRDMNVFVENISISEKQQLEIAKALVSNAEIIVMDEPTTSLTISETEHLFKIIKQLKSEGKGIVYISHKMKEIKEIGDRVTVLKDGTYVGTRKVDEVEIDELVTMMVGRTIHGTYHNKNISDFKNEPVILEVKNISKKDGKVKNVSFKTHKGEILGFAGLVGSGRTELMDTIFGSGPKSYGEVFLNGRKLDIKNPYNSIKYGLAMVTENRRETGFMDNFDIKQNISVISNLKKSKAGGTIGLLDDKGEVEKAQIQVKDLRVKCTSIHQNITELSGGNQQKVILGKWMGVGTEFIIFDEPTKGIDVGSKSEIYELMRRLAEDGKGVIVVSSELPELLSVCDTICVFKDGKIIDTFDIKNVTEEKIVSASTGESGKVKEVN
ncbi:ATP-binding cassette domain-containing protein [Alkalibaculum sp. M08DMB]|uniref:ATP-binding cassette domain-containing protein n=1 Tax=Alkalibaculum sporogenes TaxID=2655001 RepID=A0A6A7K4Q2_9FIRM|nr:ATP-binding cassette domain-containing protein [Alkalibaculum sporogenes]MPW24422.1 ATP-binding cassette domain-containing protein [Alkalibaculum sporogenes]